MKIESRGTRITDVPGVAEALVLEPTAHFQVQITFDGGDERFVAPWTADEFHAFADAIDAIRDMLPAPTTPEKSSPPERVLNFQDQAELLTSVDLSRPFTSAFSSEAKAPEMLYGNDWADESHSSRALEKGCPWPNGTCVGHVVTADPASWPSCSGKCRIGAGSGHDADCRRAPYARGAKP